MTILTSLSNRLTNIYRLAISNAKQSTMAVKHGAVLFGNGNRVYAQKSNCSGGKVISYDVPSIHAEANCLTYLYQSKGSLSLWV